MFQFDQSYFELFGLDPVFQLDLALLAERHQQILLQTHPDRFATSAEQDKRLAVQYSSFANQAFQILKNPLSRAVYLIQLRDETFDLSASHQLPMDFLMQQMTWRERMAAASDEDQLLALESEIRKQRKQLISQLESLFVNNDDATLLEQKNLTLQLAFYKRLLNEIEEKL